VVRRLARTCSVVVCCLCRPEPPAHRDCRQVRGKEGRDSDNDRLRWLLAFGLVVGFASVAAGARPREEGLAQRRCEVVYDGLMQESSQTLRQRSSFVDFWAINCPPSFVASPAPTDTNTSSATRMPSKGSRRNHGSVCGTDGEIQCRQMQCLRNSSTLTNRLLTNRQRHHDGVRSQAGIALAYSQGHSSELLLCGAVRADVVRGTAA